MSGPFARLPRRQGRAAEVRALLLHRLRALAGSTLDRGGEVTESELARVERLDRLALLVHRHEADYRWPLLVLGSVLVFAVLVLLWWTRVGRTEITLTADVSDLGFTLAASQPLIGPTALVSLAVAGLSAVELPGRRGEAPRVWQAADGDPLAVTLQVPSDGSGQLTFDPGDLPEGTRVWLRATDRPNAFVMSLRMTQGGEIAAVGRGSLTARGPGGATPALDLRPAPQGIRFLLGPGAVADFTFEVPGAADLRLELGEQGRVQVTAATEVRLRPELRVKDLQLYRVPQQFGSEAAGRPAGGPPARQISTLLTGALYFEDIGGKEVKLHAGQELVLGGLDEARLLRVNLTQSRIAFALRGPVTSLDSGPDLRWSLMPTRAEWLEARHLAKLLWAGLGVFLAVVAILAQWRAKG